MGMYCYNWPAFHPRSPPRPHRRGRPQPTMVEHADAKPAGPVRVHHPDFPRVSGSLDTGSNTTLHYFPSPAARTTTPRTRTTRLCAHGGRGRTPRTAPGRRLKQTAPQEAEPSVAGLGTEPLALRALRVSGGECDGPARHPVTSPSRTPRRPIRRPARRRRAGRSPRPRSGQPVHGLHDAARADGHAAGAWSSSSTLKSTSRRVT